MFISTMLVLSTAMTVSLAGCGGTTQSTGTAESEKEESSAQQAETKTAKTIKIAHNQADTHPVQLALLQFKEEVEAGTDGSITVEIYPSGQLADDTTAIDQVKLGSIQGAVVMGSVGTFTDAGTAYGCIEELPFLFSDYEEARAAWDGALGEEMTQRAETQGLKVINYWENGFRNMTNNIRPIYVPEDMKGIKFRVATSEIRTKTFETLNASAIPIAFTELFTALQQNTVDGQENPLSIIQTSQFYEVQKYLSLSRHIYNTAAFIINPAFWEGLTEDEQNVIMEAAERAKEYDRELDDENEETAIDLLEEKGMEINEIDVAAFQEAVQPVWDYYVDTYGDDAQKLLEAAKQ